ncbi:2-oxo-4-hydroxy-4-carboxy-5-ureidoimidazoline decarboxylase [Nocardioides bizhenqiangii]|uniref:2-oxo-4-hydroxy-4-carboxy-5-ureidoimidazoline decarboxylase n=1 Tax=Nocardioides bizhenqiangii TaxID=3095076 RepID=A0ABZ0ZT53_9ACTN|nr:MULTISPECIES: 2-oxo-4-hydroxy-4-carboxy-5-ureidoimidazoline decarboxylase [unclassified Nocardioides]MDZ5621809.1 2-oxo-4-hydroxy-4-carboxy-5-ureidoimidazoline decarboxylase [Nocardioides sp. HM23]WQQ27506.1 2-oxo-4-hydroxy-4-carboxy-5-ureidoimidazoline decarboxylase [Nocardioides sp. HM61]
MRIEEFNALPGDEAEAALRACVAIDSWTHVLAVARPYGEPADLFATARAQAATWTPAEIEGALADHPRIGERPTGSGTAADHSRREQGGLDPADADLADRLRMGNLAYEEKFGRIYLARAKGRTGAELLALLEERLVNDPATELAVTKEQLAEIALLRLTDLLATESVSA